MSEDDRHPDNEGPRSLLPEAVRHRVTTLAADALAALPPSQLPPSLKRVATFAPARRARLAGNRIAAVLETDETFRDRIAVQVRGEMPELSSALDHGAAPPAADPVEVAALAYLLRPTGWEDLLARAEDAVARAEARTADAVTAERLNQLSTRLAGAQGEVRELKERARQQAAALKTENSELRSKLNETRARARSAEKVAADAKLRAGDAERRAEAAVSSAGGENRKLRARVDELEREMASRRSSDRGERAHASMRARLLLDTVLDATQGLRRELALPPVEGSPAELVEADIAERGARTSSGHGSLSPDDPALLDQLLRLPTVHLVVDGYNVTKHAWPETSLENQRERLVGGLAPLAARTRAEVTVVFDAADTVERPLVQRPRGVKVLYSPYGVIADDLIRDLVAVEPRGRPLVVVTSDQAVVQDVRRAGARVVAAGALSRLLSRS